MSRQKNLGIGVRTKLLIIVNFPIENDGMHTIPRNHRLVATCAEIYDREPCMAECRRLSPFADRLNAAVIRSAVPQAPQSSLHTGFSVLQKVPPEAACDSTHNHTRGRIKSRVGAGY
jgi:hypothetical protein